MECPVCEGKKAYVTDSRYVSSGAIRRRRECSLCKHRYTTYERIEDDLSLIYVYKRNANRVKFNRNKLFSSITLACYKRPITNIDVDNITKDIISELCEIRKDSEKPDIYGITTMSIREIVTDYLLHYDLIACIRYASYQYTDLSQFYDGILKLKEAYRRM